MSAQHTPTPWTVMEHPSGSDWIIQDDESPEGICEFPYGVDVSPHKENAAFIVRACNVHGEFYELVQALASACDGGLIENTTDGDTVGVLLDAARAALAKAGA